MDSIFATDAIEPGDGFGRRQVLASPTPYQLIFDIVFGILMPVLCFYFDPGIIRGGFSTSLQHYGIFIYTLSVFAILALSVWLAFGHRIKSSGGVFAGILLTGAVCSFLIGALILPLTIIGIFFLIGLLGFVPFFTAFVYLRNGLRAYMYAPLSRSTLVATVVLSAFVVAGASAFTQWQVNRIVTQSMNEIITGDSDSAGAAIRRVKYFSWVIDADKIVLRYERESDPARKERLARAYKEITGQGIEIRLRILND